MENISFNQELAEVLEMNSADLSLDFKLRESGYWDSLSIVSTLALVSRHFGVSVSGDYLEKCQTLQDIYEYIQSKKEAI